MLKKINKFFVIFSLFIILPFAMLLVGCGATPVSDALKISFVSSKYEYDEESKQWCAVFEVDYNVETMLDFKVNPSMDHELVYTKTTEINEDGEPEEVIIVNYNVIDGSSYPITYAVIKGGESEQNRSRFNLIGGKITVIDKDFEEIKVKIYINKKEDICIIRLKKYPSEIFLKLDETKSDDGIVIKSSDAIPSNYIKEKNDYVNAGGNYLIHVIGKFYDSSNKTYYFKEINDDEYNFSVAIDEGSDKTVFNIMNSERLKVCSQKSKIETATVVVTLLDTTKTSKGEKFVVKLNLTVVLSPSSSFVRIIGYDDFIVNGDSIEIDASKLELNTEKIAKDTYYILEYDVELFNVSGIQLKKDEYNIDCACTQKGLVISDSANKVIKIRKPPTGSNLSFDVTINSSANTSSGNSYSMTFTINFIFPD